MAVKILIVEDHLDSLELLVLQLKFLGYEVIAATTAEEGIEKAQNQLPELVLMDLGLPGMNGIEATHRIKQDPRTAHIPVIAHTVWNEEEFRTKGAAAGIAEFLVKPTPPYRFQTTIEKHLRARAN